MQQEKLNPAEFKGINVQNAQPQRYSDSCGGNGSMTGHWENSQEAFTPDYDARNGPCGPGTEEKSGKHFDLLIALQINSKFLTLT